MQRGTIKRLTDRGFGFIAIEGKEKDLFFHSNELEDVTFDELREGDAVQFEITQGPKGPSATKVSRAGAEEAPAEEKAVEEEAPAEAEETEEEEAEEAPAEEEKTEE